MLKNRGIRMTIKDIAMAAGVSIATVSKVLNGKEEGVSVETRNRVLQVVRENNFVPYSKIRHRLAQQSGVVSVILPEIESPFFGGFYTQLSRLFQPTEYTLSLALTGFDTQAERTAIDSLCERQAAGAVLYPSGSEIRQYLLDHVQRPSAIVLIDADDSAPMHTRVSCHYAHATLQAVQLLLKAGARQVGLIVKPGSQVVRRWLTNGYRRALLEAGFEYDPSLMQELDEHFDRRADMLLGLGVNAVVCQDMACAQAVYAYLSKQHLSIPDDVGVVSLEDAPYAPLLTPPLTTCGFSPEALAQACFCQLMSQLKPKSGQAVEPIAPLSARLTVRRSVGQKTNRAPCRIAVVGWLNMDINLEIPYHPALGNALTATHMNYLPGGKGGNQAMGAVTLGASAAMVGVLGNDLYGKQIYAQLMRSGVDMQAVTFDERHPTGTAYIHIIPDGSSTTVGNAGANCCLNREYISRFESTIVGASFCLAEGELAEDALAYLFKLCKKNGICSIFKPNLVPTLLFMQKTIGLANILVPNENELNILMPGASSVEEKAHALLNLGVEHVIVTRGAKGCVWFHAGGARAYPATPVRCIDSTGASDVFISCLAAYLSESCAMEEAIYYANAAAGYSVMWKGVQNAIPDRQTLESLCAPLTDMNLVPNVSPLTKP